MVGALLPIVAEILDRAGEGLQAAADPLAEHLAYTIRTGGPFRRDLEHQARILAELSGAPNLSLVHWRRVGLELGLVVSGALVARRAYAEGQEQCSR